MADSNVYKGDGNGYDYGIVPTALANALGSLKSDLRVTSLINNYSSQAKAQGSRYASTVRLPFVNSGGKSARNKTPGTAFDTTAVTTTATTLTINKHKFWDVLVEDYGSLFAQEGIMEVYADEGRYALAEAIESDVIGLYAGLSQSVGSAGGGLTDAVLRAVRKQARDSKFRMNRPIYFVYGPEAEEDLLGIDKQVLVNESGTSQALISATFGTRYGMNFVTSNLMPAVTGSPTAEHALCFQSEAFGIAFVDMSGYGNYIGANAFQVGMVYSDDSGAPSYSMRMKASDEHRSFGTLLTADTIYGVAEMRDALAIDVLI